MNNDRFLDAFVYIGGVIAFLLVLGWIYNTYHDPTPPSTVEVVETWDGCDIIRYEDPSQRYHYFLKCK